MVASAIILTGGRSSRFGGAHKPGTRLGEHTVISRIRATIATADPACQLWVAGSTRGLSAEEAAMVNRVQEEPAHAGPLAGIDAACRAMPGYGARIDVVLVLAGDMPLLGPVFLRELVTACRESGQPATARDAQGTLQYLCTAWPAALLASRLAELAPTANKPVKLLFGSVDPVIVPVDPTELADFDTPDDFTRVAAAAHATGDPDFPGADQTF